jgi:hypothetical protein
VTIDNTLTFLLPFDQGLVDAAVCVFRSGAAEIRKLLKRTFGIASRAKYQSI